VTHRAPIDPPAVYVRDTGTAKGRGAFAARAHSRGEVVEECPVVLFDGSFSSVPDAVRRVLFDWGYLAEAGERHCLALGYGSLYNHDNPANMRYEADARARVLRFVAVRDIAAHEELTVNYNAAGGGHESEDDRWFQRMGVTPILGA
jgi:hypothetical protein